MEIKFVTDYVCPYCIVAKVALKKALEKLGVDAIIETVPYELTPLNKKRVDTFNDPIRREHYKILTEPCSKLGLDLTIPPNVIPRPYTHSAFEGYYYAKQFGREEQYSDEVYFAYFKDQLDISDFNVLADIINKIGLDKNDFLLKLDNYDQKVNESVKYCKEELKIKGVPTIYINDEKINIAEYSVDEFVEIISLHQMSETECYCGEDGCSFH